MTVACHNLSYVEEYDFPSEFNDIRSPADAAKISGSRDAAPFPIHHALAT